MSRKMRLPLIVVILAIISAVTAQRDPCDLRGLPGRDFWAGPIKPLQKCFDNVEFNKTEARQSAYVLSQIASLYSFTDLVSKSGSPWNMTVDLRVLIKQLQLNVEADVYPNDYAFHADALRIFNQLYDAHTQYRLPTGYLNATFVRPLSIRRSDYGAFITAQGPLGDLGDELYKQLFGIDLKPYVGMLLNKLDNQPVQSYLSKASDVFFTQYKDRNVRFNALIRQKGWAFVPLQHFSLDVFPPTTVFNSVELPNFIYYPGGLNSTYHLKQKNNCSTICLNKPFTIPSNVTAHRASQNAVGLRKPIRIDSIVPKFFNPHDEKHEVFQEVLESLKRTSASRFKPNKASPSKISESFDKMQVLKSDKYNETQLLTLRNAATGSVIPVLRMRTFLPRDSYDSREVINAFVDYGRAISAQEAIVDVSHNGGGSICLSNMLLASIVGPWGNISITARPTPSFGVYDMRHSHISDLIIQSSDYQPELLNGEMYVNLETRQYYNGLNTSWYQGPVLSRGNYESQYSQKTFFPNQCQEYSYELSQRAAYIYQKLTIITDGTCGSACALFVSQLQAHRHEFPQQQIRVVSFCGLDPSIPMDTASFAGGNVIDTVRLASTFVETNFDDMRLPIPFPTSAVARFNFHEYYINAAATTPREFMKLPADVHTPQFCDALWNDDFSTNFGLESSYMLYNYALRN